MQDIYNRIIALAKQFEAHKLVLYGSRARGDNRDNSDIDIAIYEMPESNHSLFADAIDDLDTLFEFDIVFIEESTNVDLLRNIEREGKVLLEKKLKREKLSAAIETLKKAINEHDEHGLESSRDGAIQRFEFCAELSWKAVREYLLDDGYNEDLGGPKSVMRKGFSFGVIKDETTWIKLLQDRNLTSHLYDEEVANKIYLRIKNEYVGLLEELADFLNNK